MNLDVGARNCGGGSDPEGRRRNVPGHSELSAPQRLPSRNLNRAVRSMYRGAERAQRKLSMIPRGGRLFDDCRARALQAGEQYRALHLGARDLGPIADPFQVGAMDREWGLVVDRVDARTHHLERHDDPSHRPPGQRRVAHDDRLEWMRGEHAREQPHGRARVPGVERRLGSAQATQAAPLDLDRQPALGRTGAADLDARHTQAVERRLAIGTLRILRDGGSPLGQRAEQRIPMRNRFVPG